MSNWEYYIKTIIKYGIFAVLFTPLIYTNFTFFPFIVGKTLFFRTLIEIFFVLYLILAIAYPNYRPKRSLLFSAVMVFAGISILATLFSVDPAKSFWSNQERMMGLWTLLHAMMLFIVAGSVFKTKKEWRTVFGISVWVSLLVGSLGIYQYFSDGFLHATGGGRVYSTLGNFIYFGGYGLFHAIISGFFFLEEKIKKSIAGAFWIVGMTTGLISVYLSGTRGALVAFCAAVVFGIILHALFYPSKKVRFVFVSILLVCVLSGLGLWFNKDSSFVKKNYLISSMLNISFKASTGETRLINWGVGFEAWKERPLLGWGPDTYFIAFNKHYNPKMYEFGEYETWQDHAHNIIIDTLNEVGIIGLIAYLFVFILAFYLIRKGVKNKKFKFSSGVLLFLALSAYFIQNIFVFDTLTLLMFFYLILAFVHSFDVYAPAKEDDHCLSDFVKKLDPIFKNAVIGILLLSLVFLIYCTNITQLRASAMSLGALKNLGQNFNSSIETLRSASLFNSPYLQETRDEIARTMTLVLRSNTQIPKQQMKSLLVWSAEELEKNVSEHPLDFYHWNYLGQWYFTLAQVLEDNSYYIKSKEAIDKAIELAPKRQHAYFTLGRYYLIVGDYTKAAETFKFARDLALNVRESRWNLGIAYVYINDLENAYDEFIEARKLGASPTNKAEILMALAAYVDAKDADGIEWLFSKCVKGGVCGPLEHAQFAGAYKKLGDFIRMEELKNAALQAAPQASEQIEKTIADY